MRHRIEIFLALTPPDLLENRNKEKIKLDASRDLKIVLFKIEEISKNFSKIKKISLFPK